ncbi:hypothetical protein ACH5RR_008223 [Cinchona calisaya]|uniref:Leucine-rich repeat-containing N-terminal plant-type domain-containing protein n=1 Tax=Cinchona calisaya TaxID=153742 RepID=A0ABD3AAR4_9GENT
MHFRNLLVLWALIIIATRHLSQGCILEEKSALLDFKASLKVSQKDAHLFLPSWVAASEMTDDCCKWERVECSNITGRIVELQLDRLRNIDLEYGSWFLNISIFLPLKELRVLDLEDNDLHGEFNLLNQLEFLDLSYNNDWFNSLSFKESNLEKLEVLNLGGNHLDKLSSLEALTSLKAVSLRHNGLEDSSIFQGICKLKNLVHLDLSENGFSDEVPLCISNLTSLRFFDISNNNFSGNIPPFIDLLNLEYVSLSGNYFDGSFPLSSLANHSKLQVFKLEPKSHDLHVDDENFVLPPSFQLRVLHLSRCNLNEKFHRIPSFLLYQNELRAIDISHNELFGELPNWLLENNTQLERVNLNNNSFTGPFILSDGPPNQHLIGLEISNNECSGLLPWNIGLAFPKLVVLHLSKNNFNGHIPQSLGNLTEIFSIDLSDNAFSGEVPDQIISGDAPLEYLILSNNRLEGQLPWSLINVTSLGTLHLDSNYFVGSISHELSHTSHFLRSLDISNNEIEGKIPDWIGNFPLLNELDMSKNLLEGTIPNAMCKLYLINLLDLSQNQLSGSIPLCFNNTSLRFIHLQKNRFTSTIPNTLLKSLKLLALDLGHNYLSGGIPHDIGQLTHLRVLLLEENNFQGQIPESMCQLKNLTFLDLSKNNFSGVIPKCFGNISFGRGDFDYEDFVYHKDLLFMISNPLLITYKYTDGYMDSDFDAVTDYSPVTYVGQENVEFATKSRIEIYVGKILNLMSGLDLSCNQLTGKIPPEFGALSDILALNLSNNHLIGSIPSSLSMLKQIESLDLSVNHLTGAIPSELTKLNSISVFNVSYNNLSGKIPDKGQFASLDESNFNGNPGLCGPLLKRSCNNMPTQPGNIGDHGEEADDGLDMTALIWSLFASYMVTIIAFFIILCISPYYRRAWFFFIDVFILTSFYKYFRSRY